MHNEICLKTPSITSAYTGILYNGAAAQDTNLSKLQLCPSQHPIILSTTSSTETIDGSKVRELFFTSPSLGLKKKVTYIKRVMTSWSTIMTFDHAPRLKIATYFQHKLAGYPRPAHVQAIETVSKQHPSFIHTLDLDILLCYKKISDRG